MLSEMQGMSRLAQPRTVRIRFRKTGGLQYISHLDLQRTIQRCIKRSGIPAWYTQGFNPHYKMVFALPLPVGVESECELLDLRIDREMEDAELLRRFNATVTDDLRGLAAYTPERSFAEIAWADYTVTLRTPGIGSANADALMQRLTTSPLTVIKRGKSGDREIDAVPLIRAASAEAGDGEMILRLCLSAAGANNLNPELLLGAVRDCLTDDRDPAALRRRVVRERLYLADGVTEFR